MKCSLKDTLLSNDVDVGYFLNYLSNFGISEEKLDNLLENPESITVAELKLISAIGQLTENQVIELFLKSVS